MHPLVWRSKWVPEETIRIRFFLKRILRCTKLYVVEVQWKHNPDSSYKEHKTNISLVIASTFKVKKKLQPSHAQYIFCMCEGDSQSFSLCKHKQATHPVLERWRHNKNSLENVSWNWHWLYQIEQTTNTVQANCYPNEQIIFTITKQNIWLEVGWLKK